MFHDRIAEAKFASLQKEFGFNTCIETGTHLGHGAMHASLYCKQVITIEIVNEFRLQAMQAWLKARFQPTQMFPESCWQYYSRSITSYHGDSSSLLKELLHSAWENVPVCFYLDAHWHEYWPLQDELSVIAEKHPRNCVIIIHDFKVPGKDFLYDSYGGQDLDYDYVKDALARINPDFKIFYNEECDPKDEPYASRRGILYATP